jgi:predicted N-acyltransferase
MRRAAALSSLGGVAPAAWDALAAGNPFVSHAFLHGLETTGCIQPAWGWQPHPVGIYDGDELVAAAPAWRKTNSHGEFVFDYGWADAYERAGGRYYPKLLVAVPYSPVVGPRLLAPAHDAGLRRELVDALADECRRLRWSGVHVNFVDDIDARVLAEAGWIERHDVQFHWTNAGYRDFDDFLDRLSSKRRKEIRRERRQVADAGWRFECWRGDRMSPAQIDLLHGLYLRTFAEKGNHAALTRAMFGHLAEAMGPRLVAFIGTRGDSHAMALCIASDDVLYGRYWGADEASPGLHFEACYYQGIAWCIEAGLSRFEPGAQGEHKLARGFLPVLTRSFHWLRDPGLHDAVARAMLAERRSIAGYRDAAAVHSPYAERKGCD